MKLIHNLEPHTDLRTALARLVHGHGVGSLHLLADELDTDVGLLLQILRGQDFALSTDNLLIMEGIREEIQAQEKAERAAYVENIKEYGVHKYAQELLEERKHYYAQCKAEQVMFDNKHGK